MLAQLLGPLHLVALLFCQGTGYRMFLLCFQNLQMVPLEGCSLIAELDVLSAESEQKPLQNRSRDDPLRSSASDPKKVNECIGHRKTGGSNLWLQSLPSAWQAAIFNWSQDMQPLEHTHIRSRPKKMQPVKGVAYQGRQYTIFSLKCRKWRHQRNKLCRDLEVDGVMRPTAAEKHLSTRCAPLLLPEHRRPSAVTTLTHLLARKERAQEDSICG